MYTVVSYIFHALPQYYVVVAITCIGTLLSLACFFVGERLRGQVLSEGQKGHLVSTLPPAIVENIRYLSRRF